MSKLVWDNTGERKYETGVDHGVLFPKDETGAYATGVVWSGLTAVSESPSGAEASPIYADNVKYLNLVSAEDFGASIEAYTYPDEFAPCQGVAEPVSGISIAQQARREFGFSYRTLIGNDVDGQEHGYKLHLVYNALAAPSEKAYSTVNESPEAMTFSWEITTTPVAVTGYKPTAHLEIDSTKADPAKLKSLEEMLYGSESQESRLPTPDEVIALFKTAA